MENNGDHVTYEPPGIASRAMQSSGKDEEEFKFASLKDLKINGEVGRVIDLEEGDSSEPSESERGEFVTDPCRSSSPARPVECAEPVSKPAVHTQPDRVFEEELVVKVPVRISPSQVRNNAPVKLVLEIQFTEE
jgi:hypothetical protein